MDFELSLPPEPEHWLPDTSQGLSQEPLELPADAALDAVVESIVVGCLSAILSRPSILTAAAAELV